MRVLSTVLRVCGALGLGSLALLAVQLFAIGSVCLLCEGVHIACAVLLVLSWRQREGRAVGRGLLDRIPNLDLV